MAATTSRTPVTIAHIAMMYTSTRAVSPAWRR
jgi:hypothetical protein